MAYAVYYDAARFNGNNLKAQPTDAYKERAVTVPHLCFAFTSFVHCFPSSVISCIFVILSGLPVI